MKSSFFNVRLTALPLALAIAFPCVAQTTLNDVVVSASRAEQRVQDALPATTLITRADIERAQTPDLPTLLKRVAGVQIAQNGGQGTLASAFVRGAESRHTLVLIDGVPVNNLNFGTAALEHLPLANVERIEVVRGNVASLYGSAALGGVIQIFTREATGLPQLSLSTQAGSHGLAQVSAGSVVKLASGTRLSATLEELNTQGFNAINQTERAGTNPDTDGYKRRAISAGVTQDIGQGHTLGVRLREAKGTVRYDSQFGPATQADESKYVERGAVIEGKFKLGGHVNLDAALTSSADKLNAQVTAFPYFVNSYTHGAQVGLDWQVVQGQHLTAGIENTRQRIESDTVYNRSSRTQDSLRVGYQADWAQHQVQFNLRRDKYSDFGSASTYLAAYAYRLTQAWRINASASTGFNAPTFNDLYYPFGGNALLRPERVRSSEIGLQYAIGVTSVRAVLFNNRFTDLIANDIFFNRVNIGKARNQGLELEYKTKLNSGTELRAGWTAQHPIDLTTGQRLTRRAASLGNLGATQDWGTWSLDADLRYSGARPDGANTLASYSVLDLSLSYAVNKKVKVFGRLDNAFARHYETVYGYNQPGREVFVGLRWSL